MKNPMAFYENKPLTWRLVTEMGGVCGEVSKTTVGALQSRGIPAILVGQMPDSGNPNEGHCALIWAKPNAEGSWDWEFYNAIPPLEKSYRHDRIKTPWLNEDWMEKVDNKEIIIMDLCFRVSQN